MKTEPTTEDAMILSQKAINSLKTFLESLAENNPNKCIKLSYWIIDWVRFLNKETTFSSSKLCKYKRGQIIKVHLGFNIGSEEGGLHYAVVVDKDNSINDPVIRIIPLTSVKNKHDTDNLPRGNVFIGNELFRSLSSKVSQSLKSVENETYTIQSIIEKEGNGINRIDLKERLDMLQKNRNLVERTKCEITKMKQGSIALVSQVTTISKLRIYDPRSSHDVLSNVKLSSEKLDLIDKELLKNYTKFIDK